jgi:predicted AAA+ superfamily ATPase
MWIYRDISPVLQTLSEVRPAVLLTGARQAGKTSLLERAFPDHAYVSLDLPSAAEEAEENGEAFLAKHSTPLIIDEVQYAPRLFRYLKHAIDQRRDVAGQFLLTGSQKFSLMQGVSESLAGRISIVELHSLSLTELERHTGQSATSELLWQWLFAGGYPELYARSLEPTRFYSDYVTAYLERDVRQVLNVRSLRDFDRFLRLCAIRTGQLVSANALAAEVGISAATARSWLSVLEASSVIVLLEPYYANLGKRLVKTPKLYFADTGLACFLAGFRSVRDLRDSALLGAFFETLVLGQIIRWFTNRGERPLVYFYRDHQGNEVDFVLPIGERLRLVEAKLSEAPDPNPRGFVELSRTLGAERILSRTLVTPRRGQRTAAGGTTTIADAVDFSFLGV